MDVSPLYHGYTALTRQNERMAIQDLDGRGLGSERRYALIEGEGCDRMDLNNKRDEMEGSFDENSQTYCAWSGGGRCGGPGI